MNIFRSTISDSATQSQMLGSKDSITRQIVSSSLGSIITISALNPLNVIKVNLQKQSQHSISINSMILSLFRSNGIRGFWAGASSGLFMSIPNTVMYMVCYEHIKKLIASNTSSNLQPVAPAAAGIFARAVSVSIISPLELTRTIQTGSASTNASIMSTLTNIFQQHGIKGLYKGWWSTILRDCPFSGIYWFSFEYFKPKYLSLMQPTYDNHYQPLITFCSGATSGTIAAFITHPFDVVKTYQQLSVPEGKSSIISSFATIWRSSGWVGLFRGLTLRLLTVIPSSAVMITVYEFVKSLDM